MKKIFLLSFILTACTALHRQASEEYFKQGNAKFLKNDFDGAQKDFTKAIELNPKFFDAYINRGRLKHNKFSDDKGAIMDYDKAIGLNPKSGEAYFYRANAYRNLREFEKACSDWSKAAELGSMDAKSSINKYCK